MVDNTIVTNSKDYYEGVLLAQKVAESKAFPCILGKNRKGKGPGTHCDECPALDVCPALFKHFSD
jgi:hypothetical protein